MKLQKRVEPKKQVEQRVLPRVKNSDIDWHQPIPAGKYLDKTLEWVRVNDNSYLLWMHETDLIRKWGLVVIQDLPKQEKRYDKYVTDEGVTWLALYGIEAECEPSKYL